MSLFHDIFRVKVRPMIQGFDVDNCFVYETCHGTNIAFVLRRLIPSLCPKGKAVFKKLKVYAGEAHPHEAQQPQEINL